MRGQMPAAMLAPIARPRLVARLVGARAGIVEAAAGHGISTLLEQAVAAAGIAPIVLDLDGVGPGVAPVLAAFRRAVHVAGLGTLEASLDRIAEDADEDRDLDDPDQPQLIRAVAAAVRDELTDRSDPVLLVVDGLTEVAGGPAGRPGFDRADLSLIAALVGAFHDARRDEAVASTPLRVIVAGRSVPVHVSAALPEAVHLRSDDLAFDQEEAEVLLRAHGRPADPVAAAALLSPTGGWPAAVALAVVSSGDPARGATAGLAASVETLLAQGDAASRAATRAVAQLPRFDAATARAAAGPDALEHMLGSGLAVRRRADGWFELPEPVRLALHDPASLGPGRVRAVADAYLDAAEPALALRFLLASGDPDALAATLAGRSWHELTVLDASELRAALTTVPAEVIARHPRVLLAAARVAESGVHTAWRARLLAQAREAADQRSDQVLRREVVAEQAADASRSGDAAAVALLAAEVLDAAGPDEARTRAVALTAVGRIDAFSRDSMAMSRAADRLAEAAALLRTLPEPDLLRGTLQVLGYGVHFARGDLDAAIAALREAADLVPGAIRTRAGVQTFLADALVASGALDDAEAVLRDVAGVARRLRDERLLAYHAWMQASIASRRDDQAGVEAWLAEAERHPADWFAHPTGIEFLADATDFLGRVGLDAEAARMLARVEARCSADGREGIDQIALVARAIHGARAGDPITAEADLVACLSIEQVAPREHWRIHLLRGLAAARAGEPDGAARHARRAFAMAAAMGHADLPRLLEPGVVRRLESVLAGLAAGPEPAPDGAARIGVRVLGRFAVLVDGRPVDPLEGRPGQLVKLLAVAGRELPIDEVVEAMWPDADPDVGRRRLRNVVARVRASCGDLVLRTDEALSLDPEAEVDLARFEADARAALAAAPGSQESLVRAALGRYAGELLPADRYEDFTAAPRERVLLRHLALLDRLAALTAERGDIDEALALHEEAIAAEPLDEQRYRAAIEVALRYGRRDRAIRLVERALATEAELADEPSPELAALARSAGKHLPGAASER